MDTKYCFLSGPHMHDRASLAATNVPATHPEQESWCHNPSLLKILLEWKQMLDPSSKVKLSPDGSSLSLERNALPPLSDQNNIDKATGPLE